MILLTGATGTIGRVLTEELRSAGAAVRAMSRDPDKARRLLGADVELFGGDFTRPATLAPALDRIEVLFLLSAPGPAIADHDTAMVEAARLAGVRKVVKLSAIGTDAVPPLRVSAWHLPGERAVMESGMAWTLLRPAGFASNALGWASSIRARGTVQVSTGEGRQAVVDPRDVAAVAARTLLSSEHEGRAYTLTGPEALSVPDQLRILAQELGRSIEPEHVSPAVAARRMLATGVPEFLVHAAEEGAEAVRDGRAEARTDAVARILGRAPRSFETWVRDHLGLFR